MANLMLSVPRPSYGGVKLPDSRWPLCHDGADNPKYGKLDPAMVEQTVRARYATTLNAGQLQPTIDASAKYRIFDGAFLAQELIITPK